jgi:hypothetical protein
MLNESVYVAPGFSLTGAVTGTQPSAPILDSQ